MLPGIAFAFECFFRPSSLRKIGGEPTYADRLTVRIPDRIALPVNAAEATLRDSHSDFADEVTVSVRQVLVAYLEGASILSGCRMALISSAPTIRADSRFYPSIFRRAAEAADDHRR